MNRKAPNGPPTMPKPAPPPAPPTSKSTCALLCDFLEGFQEWAVVAAGRAELLRYHLDKLPRGPR